MSYLIPSQAGKAVAAQKTLYQTRQENAQLREAIALAYGYLWHVNNEPGTPSQYPPERAAYEARKALCDLMTHEQRGEAINRVRDLMGHNAKLTGGREAD